MNTELKINNNRELIELRKTLRNLASDKTIYLTKPGKGREVVIMKREEYIKKMGSIPDDTSVFKYIAENPSLKKEERLTRILNRMKTRNFITPEEFNRFKPKGSRPARIYGLPKAHKTEVPLRPIVSDIGSFNFGIGRLVAGRLATLRTSKNMIKDTFSFIEFIHNLSPDMANHRMISFDVCSLFTKVPLNYTIDVILRKL